MKFAVIYRPQLPAPRDQQPQLLKEMGAWVEKFGDRVTGVEFFVDGGGLGFIETDDAEELTRLVAENPFSPYSEIEIKPVVAPERAMAILAESLG